MSKQITVYYDSGCPLCLREIRLMRSLDRRQRIDFIDVLDPTSACPLDRQELLARFHARENGKLVSGAAAFAAMWRQIPLLKPIGLLARNRWVLSALEWTYLRFLTIRPTLQRWIA